MSGGPYGLVDPLYPPLPLETPEVAVVAYAGMFLLLLVRFWREAGAVSAVTRAMAGASLLALTVGVLGSIPGFQDALALVVPIALCVLSAVAAILLRLARLLFKNRHYG